MDAPVLPRFRPELAGMDSFSPTALPVGPDGRSHPLAANESPHGPLPAVTEAVARAAAAAHRYPDHASTALVGALAERLGVTPGHLVVGCGSTGLIQALLGAVAEPGGEAVFGWRSFEAYPRLVTLAGLRPVPVPLRDSRQDLDAMAAAVGPRTRLVIVCNPNSPTGTGVPRDELERFLDRVPSSCLVVLDEAYREYVRDPAVPDGLTLRPRPNVAVLRTFSKAYGLAALRVGYCVAPPPAAAMLRRCALSYGVSGVAEAAAVASLAAAGALRDRVERDVAERDRLAAGLRELGLAVPDSEGNFVWVPAADTGRLTAACAARGVAVRASPGEGVRVTVGSPEANDEVLAAAAAAVPALAAGGRR